MRSTIVDKIGPLSWIVTSHLNPFSRASNSFGGLLSYWLCIGSRNIGPGYGPVCFRFYGVLIFNKHTTV